MAKDRVPTARVVKIKLTGARKANDNIPADEMLLAEALAAARARGLGWCAGEAFDVPYSNPEDATKCCAVGALALAGKAHLRAGTGFAKEPELYMAHVGNDSDWPWNLMSSDLGESLGWAFRCAMQEEP